MSKILIFINKVKGFFIGFISSIFSGIVFVSAQSDNRQMQDLYGVFIAEQQPTLWVIFKEMWLPISLIIALIIGAVVFISKTLYRRSMKNKFNLSDKL